MTNHARSLVATLVAIPVIALTMWVIGAWVLMLTAGNIHLVWNDVPAISYTSALGILLPVIVGMVVMITLYAFV